MDTAPAITDTLSQLLEELRELRAEVRDLREEVRELRAGQVQSDGAAEPVEGTEAAGRVVGVSGRSIRRWLARCPRHQHPSATSGGRPVWESRAAVETWWRTRHQWATGESVSDYATANKIKEKTGRRSLRDRVRDAK